MERKTHRIVGETDEELMMKFLEGEEFTVKEIKDVIRKETIGGRMVPMFCGSAYRNKGVQMMLDGVVDYMPSPLDIPPIKGIDPTTEEEVERVADDKGPFSALAFKIMADPFVGKLAFLQSLLRNPDNRFLRLQLHEGQEGKNRTYSADARKPPSGDRRGLLR